MKAKPDHPGVALWRTAVAVQEVVGNHQDALYFLDKVVVFACTQSDAFNLSEKHLGFCNQI